MSRGAPNAVASAGLALAAVLVVSALPRSPGPAPRCDAPRQVGEGVGRIARVACGGRGAPLRGATRLLFGLKLDLNCAGAEAFEALPGIGPARAAAIVRERNRRPFGASTELARVRGIGHATVRSLEAWLEVGAAADAGACLAP